MQAVIHPQLRGNAIPARPASAGGGRVLLLSTDMGMGGGAEEQVIQLSYALQSRDWKCAIVSLLPPSPMPADFTGHQIPLLHLGMRRAVPDPRGIQRLAKIIREFKPDVIHSHMVQANLLARVTRLIQPYPVLVCTLHALTMAGMERDHSSVFETAHRLTDGLADCTTAICHAASDYYVRRRAVPDSKMRVIPNGISSARFRHNPHARERLRRDLGLEDKFVWLAVGRLEAVKAYPTLLRAFARLGSGPQVLLICGIGSVRENLQILVDELDIGDRVRFLGLRDDVHLLASSADAFALSSDSEGLPLVLLQAAAAQLPIVATNVGGNPEAVVAGVNGFVVEPGDPQTFADSMARVMSMPAAERSAMGAAGRARVQQLFEAENVFDQWEKLYGELLDRARYRRRFAARAG